MAKTIKITTSKRGGARTGAGRKTIPNELKVKEKNVKIDENIF